MLNFSVVGSSFAAALAVMALTTAPASATILGPDANICAKGDSPSVLVRVPALKARTGNLRVQVYGNNSADFLAKGKYLKRVDLPVTASGPMEVCVALPKADHYAIAVRHDVDGNGKSGWSDGGGFSRNPSLSIFSLQPDYNKVVMTIGWKTQKIDVYMNYRKGTVIRPLKP
ncbi:MAG: DUF2141 domain-containing protein [Sphingobium sp.]|nr:DUF2141 domain-containing protein [Sphingobium sp.]